MKKHILLWSTPVILFLSCNPGGNKTKQETDTIPQVPKTVPSGFIPLDSANKMITSYYGSLSSSGAVSDSDLLSLSFDAAQLRAYLSDPDITAVKISFAHTLSYINAGHANQDADYNSSALTLIISGYDNLGNFVYHGSQVLDFAVNCPTNCPPGEAGNITFPIRATRQ